MQPQSKATQRSYLEGRLEALLTLRAAANQQALTARANAAELAPTHACRKEIARLQQLADRARARGDQLTRAIRVIELELEEEAA